MSPAPHVIVALLLAFSQTQCEAVEEVVTLVTDNLAHYEADLTYTIEHFKELPLHEEYFSFETPTIPSLSPKGVQWSFVILPASFRHGSKDFGLVLNLKALPENTRQFEVNTECSIVGRDGKRHKTRYGKETFKQSHGSFVYVDFAARSELDTEANGLLRNGHLTINCKIDGSLIPESNEHEFIPTVEVETPTNVTDASNNCSFASSTLSTLVSYDFELMGDGILRASGEDIQVHKDIIAYRSNELAYRFRSSSLVDFGNELDVSDLKTLVTFMYEGKTVGLTASSCFKLYGFAKSYAIKCLESACANLLIQGLTDSTARQTLDLALDNNNVNLARKAASFLSKSF